MLTDQTVAAAARDAGIDVLPRYVEETASTQEEARALADAGAPEWTVVVAGHQTAGRGRLGRGWASVPGKGLQLSMVLRPPLALADAPVVSLLAAAAMAAACREATGVEVASEWPNDLVAGGRKLGGILAESRVEGGRLVHLVLGIGVNVSHRQEDLADEIRGTATSLALQGGRAEPEAVLERFLRELRRSYRPEDEGFVDAALERYRAVCVTLGRSVRATVRDGRVVEGRAVGLDERGGLLLERDGERLIVSFGEIFHLD